MKLTWLLVFGLLSVLPGCRIGEPNRLEFSADPRILRGRYSGTVDTRYASGVVALSADNTVLAMGAGNRRAVVQLWDVATQTPVKSLGTLSEAAPYTDDVAITADGSVVGSVSGNRVQLWNTQTGAQLTLDTEMVSDDCANFCAVKFDLSSGGRLVAAGDKRITLFDAQTGAQLRALESPGASLETLVFSADGTRLAAFSTDLLESDAPFTFHVRVWNPLSGEIIFSHSGTAALTPRLALSADGKRLAFAEGSMVRVVEVDSGQNVALIEAPSVEVPWNFSALTLNPDGSQLSVTIYRDNETTPAPATTTTILFDTDTEARVAELKDVYLGEWSQDGTRVLAYDNLETEEGPALLDAATFETLGRFVNGELYEVSLEATPSYVDAQHYTVSGTLTLNGGPPVAFTGQVKGNEAQRYLNLSPQARLPYPAELTLELEDNPLTLYGRQEWRSPDGSFGNQQDHAWTGYVLDTSQPAPLYGEDGTLTLDRADGSQ